jgi:hypothetical protein
MLRVSEPVSNVFGEDIDQSNSDRLFIFFLINLVEKYPPIAFLIGSPNISIHPLF